MVKNLFDQESLKGSKKRLKKKGSLTADKRDTPNKDLCMLNEVLKKQSKF